MLLLIYGVTSTIEKKAKSRNASEHQISELKVFDLEESENDSESCDAGKSREGEDVMRRKQNAKLPHFLS